MSKDDYKDKFEEHRQNIDGAEEETTQKMSRTERYRGEKGDKPQKKKRHLMEYLSITFILILLSILIFVALFYEPGKDVKQVVNDEDEVEVVKDAEPAKKEDADKEKEEQEALAKKKAEEAQKAEEERKAKEQQEKQAAEQAEQARKAEEERKAQAAEAARQAEQARQAEAARQAEQQKAQQQQQQQQQQKPQTPQVRTHTVQAGETLYRIGVNYYGSGDESVLQKIRAANGLSSNTIQVGQQIKLP